MKPCLSMPRSSAMGFIDFYFFLLLIRGAQAFVFSCNEVKYKLINTNLEQPTRYVCLIPQEGYLNIDALTTIYAQSGKLSTSFADLLNQCVERPSNGPWRIVADLPVTLDCSQELSLIFTSSSTNIINTLIEPLPYSIAGEQVIVNAETGIRIRKRECTGNGNVTYCTGAGNGVGEKLWAMPSWSCADLPEWIISFENVITITTDAGVNLIAEISSNFNSSVIGVTSFQRTAVISDSHSDNLQFDSFVAFSADSPTSINMTCLSMVGKNNVFVSIDDITIEISSEKFPTQSSWKSAGSRHEVYFKPEYIAPEDLGESEEYFACEFALGASSTTPPLVASTTPAAPVVDTDPYCKCGLDKFGMPDGTWDPTEIWLDIAIILDTSEAMGTAKLIDAATLIGSFFGTEDDDVLTTNTNAKFFTRVGLIAMSDKPEILYNMNMTKADSVIDHVRIKDGLQQIDILAAFKAAQQMLEDGMDSEPERGNTRQVIYYMTDSAPKFDPSSPNAFKNSFGIIIVNNFIDADVIERPSLKDLASPGYYSTDLQDNYMESIQLFCKANCFCRPDHDRKAYAGHNTDPAVKASGGCFHAVPTGIQYSNLKSKNCDVGRGLIASAHDAEKTAFLSELVHAAAPKAGYFWIGYTKTDAGWTWEDKSTNPYTNWDTDNDEPSTNAVAKCTYVYMDSLLWGAGNCNTGFPGVCEYKPCSVGNDNC